MKKGRRNKTKKKLAWVDELAESFEFYWVIPGRKMETQLTGCQGNHS